LKMDEEFLPKRDRFWNERKFYLKLNRIFQVIMATGEGKLPVAIGLCEIENRNVLEMLLYKTPLGEMGYKIIHKESPDKRGIDVAVLYNSNLYTPIGYKTYLVVNPKNESFKTRDILHAEGIIESDTIHFFVNHWPSKYGGVVETKPLRALAAKTLRQKVDSLFVINPKCKIIAMGDFNDSPLDESLLEHLNVKSNLDSVIKPEIYNLAHALALKGIGSNKYHGKWELIDQIIVSGNLLSSDGLSTSQESFKVFKAPFLMEKDKNYLGQKPFRTYLGFKYNNGFSDHLPVVLDLFYPSTK
ncbi:MAG: hypothetical protein PF541_02455, partial [Prolixibacteraceae bacterium]|nr:hypothetical protein [Prolixibacteraceae bacterium]